MKLGILFWFYRDVDICGNRLKILRKYNPTLPIYGLYGGNSEDKPFYEKKLSPLLDDFFACFTEKEASWKWRNGDLMVVEWYLKRGNKLGWDTIFIAQWDMLVLTDLKKILFELKENELLLSGLRPIEEVLGWWNWVTRDRPEYLRFLENLHLRFGEKTPVFCCQFVFVCLPKNFLEKYSAMDLSLGFLEYRLPTYGHVLGIPFGVCSKIYCHWPGDPSAIVIPQSKRTLTAQKYPIDLSSICINMVKSSGDRVFHPYNRLYPVDIRSAVKLFIEILRTKLRAAIVDGLAKS